MEKTDEKSKIIEDTKFIKAVHERMTTLETDSFMVEQRIIPLSRYLMRNSECVLFLNKDNFEKLYPVLKDMVLPENKVTLIVTKDVLQNEEKDLIEKLPFIVDPELQQAQKPRLSELLGQEHIYVSMRDNNIPPFILVNHRSYLIEVNNEEIQNAFICALNAPFNAKQAERLDRCYYVFSKLRMESTPLLELQNQKEPLASQKIEVPQPFNQNTIV